MSEDIRLFDRDPFTGITEYMIYDNDTGDFQIQTQQDVEPLIEYNKSLHNATEKHTRYGELTRIASWPAVITMELAKQGILSMGGAILDEKRFRKWLNDRDNKAFRTREGTV